MRRIAFTVLVVASLATSFYVFEPTSSARSWCARELVVHEWGVHVFTGSGATRVAAPTGLPNYFHNQHSGVDVTDGPPVSRLPRDNGDRLLPVLGFYLGSAESAVPVGIRVGFSRGTPTGWYPQAPPITEVRSPAVRASQLEWPNLTLSSTPRHTRATTNVAWVNELRRIDEAAWVNNSVESERFVFYEGRTSETAALQLTRGPTYTNARRQFVLRNTTPHPVHNVFFVLNERGATFVTSFPAVPAGASTTFVVEDHVIGGSANARSTNVQAQIRATLVDPAHLDVPPATFDPSNCTMMRDPAVPVTASTGHALFAAEADTLMRAWGARFADAAGATILYREDAALLDAEMPLSVYTDMYHFVTLHRASLALIENVQLPRDPGPLSFPE